jgi:regulation of enolase protein 1 (concanavalin A-like superfamily)
LRAWRFHIRGETVQDQVASFSPEELLMSRKFNRAGRAITPGGFSAISHAIEPLERRMLLAAHILGNSAVFPTIQAAVDNAPTGGTISVDAGVYPELVVVWKPLTVLGAQSGVDARSNVRINAPTQSGESVVNGQLFDSGTRSSGFYIISNNVTVDGFTVQGQSNSGNYGAGIVIGPDHSGTKVLDNIIQNNVAGLYASNDSATTPLLIQHNVFRNNNTDGLNSGRAIYTDGGVSGGNITNVVIDSNTFIGNRGGALTSTTYEAAISFETQAQNAQSNIRITNNTFDSNGKAVLFYNANGILIDSNQVAYSRDGGSGAMRFEGNVHDVVITNNNIFDNDARGIRIDENVSHLPSSGFVITGNNIARNGLGGDGRKAGLFVDAGTYSGMLNASNNWWGSSTGPAGDGSISGGTGDAVYTYGNQVNWSGFATTPFAGIQEAPFWGAPAGPGEIIQAEDYDRGGSGVAYQDTTAGNTERTIRKDEDVDVQATSDAGGGYNIDFVRPGEWINYTINVPQSGSYAIDFRVASPQSIGGKFHVEVDGVNVTGTITMINTKGTQNWLTQTVSGIDLPAGRHVLRLVFDTNGNLGQIGNFNWLRLMPQDVAPVLPTAPAAPGNLAATASSATTVNLAWSDNSDNEDGFVIERQTAGGAWQPIATTQASHYQDTTVAAATGYSYRVEAFNSVGSSEYSNIASATTPPIIVPPPPVVPPPSSGWSDSDIGSPKNSGSASYADGVYTVTGSGSDIWSTSDQFHFDYRQVSGDFTAVARVTSISNTNAWAKAGLMVRDTLDAGSMHDSIFMTPTNGVSSQYRASTGGTSGVKTVAGPSAPYWLKIVRSGSTLSNYASADGVTWTLIATRTISLGETVYVGLAVTAHNSDRLCTATFDNVSIT